MAIDIDLTDFSLNSLNKNFTVHCGLAIGYENTKSKINNLKTEREKLENFCKFN